MVEGHLGEVLAAVDAVEDLQALLGGVLAAGLEPVHERRRFLGEAEAHQGVEGEGGVAHPGVAVVPVAGVADGLGQRRRGRRHQRPGGLVDQQLEAQRRALDHLPPPPLVARLAQPTVPVPHGGLEQPVGLAHLDGAWGSVPGEQQVGPLAGVEVEAGDGGGAFDPKRHGGAQHQAPGGRDELGAHPIDDADLVRRPGEVKGGIAAGLEVDPSPHRPRPSHDEVAVVTLGQALAPGHHEVHHLAHRIGAEEAGHEHVRIR